MNKKEQKIEIEKNRKKYTVPGCAPYQFRSKNTICFGSGGIKHELSKCVGAIMLNKYGDIKFDDNIINCLDQMEKFIKQCMIDFPKGKANFISEAQSKADKTRIVDLVRLEDETHFEWETNHKIIKPGAITIYI